MKRSIVLVSFFAFAASVTLFTPRHRAAAAVAIRRLKRPRPSSSL